jgi:UTP--glucose-1-phosphate uridylyltransferase
MKSVRTAVIPAAGLGTRFLPTTKAVPKELLPIVDRPGLHLVINEALGAGIERMVVVSHESKRAVETYFRPDPALLASLEASGKQAQADELRAVDALDVQFVYQHKPLGLGHAVGVAAEVVGDEPFVVLLPDELMGGSGLLQAMVAAYEATGGSVVGLKEVPRDQVSAYGVVTPAGELTPDGRIALRGMVEKPAVADAPSNLIIIGRYLCTPAVMREIADLRPGAGGELQLTDALRAVCAYEPFHGIVGDLLPPGTFVRHDTGNPAGWLAATIELGWNHPVYGAMVRQVIQRLITTPPST